MDLLGRMSNLKWADGTASAVSFDVANATWGCGTRRSGPACYDVYLYPFGGGEHYGAVTHVAVLGSYDFVPFAMVGREWTDTTRL